LLARPRTLVGVGLVEVGRIRDLDETGTIWSNRVEVGLPTVPELQHEHRSVG
jgi:hypothetical protein